MRNFFVSLTIFFLSQLYISAQFVDDFSDGNITENPQWVGDIDDFVVLSPIVNELKLAGPDAAGTSAIFTQSQAMESAEWKFNFRLGFNPSDNNYAVVYLVSNSSDTDNIVRSLYLKIGTKNDNISLWERKGDDDTELISGQLKRLDLSNPSGTIKVTRELGGKITLSVDTGSGWEVEGTYENHQGFSGEWFGLNCIYTKTNSSRFWFANFSVSGDVYQDTIPPALESYEVINRYKTELTFSKFVAELTYSDESFLLNDGTEPDEINSLAKPYSLELIYYNGIDWENEISLIIENIFDKNGNAISKETITSDYISAKVENIEVLSASQFSICFNKEIDTFSEANFSWLNDDLLINEIQTSSDNCFTVSLDNNIPLAENVQFYLNDLLSESGDTISSGPYDLWYYIAQPYDIIISEIMPDPDPVVALPNSEFIEFYNRTAYPISLKGYKIIVQEREVTLPESEILPNNYLVCVPAPQVENWTNIANVVGVTSWIALPNSQATVTLLNSEDEFICSLQYDSSFGEAGFKQDGGWSYEIIDVDNLSGDSDNWGFTVNNCGGTPGAENSISGVFPDTKNPLFLKWTLEEENILKLHFSEPVSNSFFADLSDVEIIPNIEIDSCELDNVTQSQFSIYFKNNIAENTKYELNLLKNPTDLTGNVMDFPNPLYFANPIEAEPLDIVISELLYDPAGDVKDFVELYNRSDKIIDLSKLYISKNNQDGVPEKLIKLSEDKKAFFPNDYLVFTSDKQALIDYYENADSWKVYEISGFPNYVNSGGTVFLTNIIAEEIDVFEYNEVLHTSNEKSKKGISLERINLDRPANELGNWASADENENFATPTYKNSQSKDNSSFVLENYNVINKYRIELTFSRLVEELDYTDDSFISSNDSKPDEIQINENPYKITLVFNNGIEWNKGEFLTIDNIVDDESISVEKTIIESEYLSAKVENIDIVSASHFLICFNKEIDNFSSSNFSFVDENISISEINSETNSCFTIILENSLPLAENSQFYLNNVISENGDTIPSGPYDLWYYMAQPYDIIISEIMPDPDPVVALPNSEFIEIYNRCEYPISLKGYRIRVQEREVTMPNVIIFPDDYLVLISATQSENWADFSNVVGITGWIALPNSEASVAIINSDDEVVSSMQYKQVFGDGSFKSDGGWSYEIKDVDNMSGDINNWGFSVDEKGGTPGEPNSIKELFLDVKNPQFLNWSIQGEDILKLYFSEPVTDEFYSDLLNIVIKPELDIDTVWLDGVTKSVCYINFKSEIEKNRKYELTLALPPVDLAGNEMDFPQPLYFANPLSPEPFDIVINELLFDPVGDVKDFVELYNRSDKIIDLSQLFAAKDNIDGLPDKMIQLSPEKRAFFPEEYLVFTADKTALINHYEKAISEQIFEVPSFPNYVNGGGVVFISSNLGVTVDQFNYSDHLHHSMLASTKGVALERINTNEPTNRIGNWHSASANENYATPTYKNSQAKDFEQVNEKTFTIEPEVFTPNMDGVDDLLFIHYKFPEEGYSCTIEIFNQNGAPVRKLVNNELASVQGFYTWDGTDDEYKKCQSGIYVILIKWFNLKGEVKQEKRVAVLGM